MFTVACCFLYSNVMHEHCFIPAINHNSDINSLLQELLLLFLSESLLKILNTLFMLLFHSLAFDVILGIYMNSHSPANRF